MTQNLPSATATVTVPFYDVDSMQVVWHGHYVKYLDHARSALLDSFGYGYAKMRDSGYAWPVIRLSLRYARPAQLGQVLRVEARMTEWEYRLVIDYEITDESGEVSLCRGSTTQIAVTMPAGETCLGSPPVLEQRLREAGYLA